MDLYTRDQIRQMDFEADQQQRRKKNKEYLQRKNERKPEMNPKDLQKFLLFNFILANDTHEVRAILESKGQKTMTDPDMILTGSDIETYRKDSQFISTLGVEKYRVLFQSCLEDIRVHRLRLARHKLFGFVNKRDLTGDESYYGDDIMIVDSSNTCSILYGSLPKAKRLRSFTGLYQRNQWKYTLPKEKDPYFDSITLLELASVLCKT